MGKPKLRDHYDLIAELGEAGKSDAAIAARLKQDHGIQISPSTISWHRLRLGAEPDRRVAVSPVPIEPRAYTRGGHTVRRFTRAEDAELLALEAQDLGDTEIGRRLGRTPNSVRGRLMILARHDARRERAEAQGVGA